MPDTYKGFKKEIRVDEYGEYAIGDTLYNHNRIFNEETRPNLVFSIFYNPDTKEITTGNIGERKDGYVELLPHKNGDGFHKYHAWRWSKQKIQNESHDLIILPTSNGGYEIYTKTRDFNKTLLKDTITNISNGDKEIKELFDGRKYFNYPKSTDLLKIILNSTQYNDDIILDFFSGSATTAHTVMQLNAEDGGNRQFIMVQLPEVCDEKSEAYKAGYQNICEIGKERIRRAGKKILEENNQMTLEDKEQLDIGFKVFKLDSSNLKTWDNTPVTAEQMDLLYERMNNMIHRVKSDRSDLDMVCEIMLKLGVPLTYSITAVEINGKTAYSIGDDCLLLICLAEDVQPEDVEQMAEYAPAKLIISRESFVDDTAMANAHYILKDHGVELKLV